MPFLDASIKYQQNFMEKVPKPYLAEKKRIHCSNMNLYKSIGVNGMIGSRHSELLSRLSMRVDKQQKENKKMKEVESVLTPDAIIFKEKVQELQREEVKLKGQMTRINQIAKANKNSKIAIEIKYEALLKELAKKEGQIKEITQKFNATNDLNKCLLKITENALCVLPHYEDNCGQLQEYITRTKHQLKNNSMLEEKQDSSAILEDLFKKLDSFKNQIGSMQHYQKKMMNNLAEAHVSTKSLSEKLESVQIFNIVQVDTFKEISQISDIFHPYDPSEPIPRGQRKLQLELPMNIFTFIPESAPRINKIFTEICMLFEQHIHLLETQKMEYQFTKNKKLLVCQQIQCSICENYEKIVSQTFSIVREAFKEIKFKLLKEIKNISDADEIPILI